MTINKKLTLTSSIVLGLASLAPMSANAQYNNNAYSLRNSSQVTVRTDTRVYAGPGRNYPSVSYVDRGQPVRLYGCLSAYSWCDVSYDVSMSSRVNGGYRTVRYPVRGWVDADDLSVWRSNQAYDFYDASAWYRYPVVSFLFDSYWRSNYSTQSWYNDRTRYRNNSWKHDNDRWDRKREDWRRNHDRNRDGDHDGRDRNDRDGRDRDGDGRDRDRNWERNRTQTQTNPSGPAIPSRVFDPRPATPRPVTPPATRQEMPNRVYRERERFDGGRNDGMKERPRTTEGRTTEGMVSKPERAKYQPERQERAERPAPFVRTPAQTDKMESTKPATETKRERRGNYKKTDTE